VLADTLNKTELSMNGKPPCGAKTRAGGKCKGIGIPPSGRCKLHGGKSLSGPASPTFKTGLHSKSAYLPPVLTARMEELTYDAIGNLEESVKTHVVLESRINEEFGEGCSLERWRELKDELTRFENKEANGDNPSPRECLEAVQTLVSQGLHDAASEERLAERLRVNHEAQRKLSESVSKIRKEMQETYTQEQWNVMLNILLNILRQEIDARTVGNIITRLAAYSSEGKGQPKLLNPRADTP
jgi:hypothetical protein